MLKYFGAIVLKLALLKSPVTTNAASQFSDDTAILGLISGTSDVTTYKHEVQNFVQWCDKHFLSISTKKTVEMMFDPKSIGDHLPVVINGQNIVQVDSCRYLGIHIDNKLTWSVQVENVCIRIQQRLFFLRRLRVFGVNQKVLLLFYHAVIESIFRYGISAWFGNLSVHLKAQITRLTQRAMKIMGVKQHPTPQALFEETVTRQAQKLFQIPLMSFTLSTNFFPREDASEFLSAGLTVLRTPLSHCPLKH